MNHPLFSIAFVLVLLWIVTRQFLLPLLPAQTTSLDDIKTLTDIIFGAITTLCTVVALVISLSKDDKTQTANLSEPIDPRSRRIMLTHVEEFWVKGILEKSLYGAALLDLGIQEKPDALDYPWTIKRESNKENLPSGKPMLEIFNEIGLGRSLLILGAPGSGKTTMLLELARQLIARARQDDTEPIPIVFNLASWNEKQTLTEWLAAELNAFYNVPKKLTPSWVASDKMLLLLDGLDEVKSDQRPKCAQAINQFRSDHGLAGMAVCSRSEEYAELKTHLSLSGAIEIQPLTVDQVTDYFYHIGPQLDGVRQLLKKDTALNEMAHSPLFLSIMTLAYRNTSSEEILVSEDLELQRKLLFDAYVARMFERPGRAKNPRFKQDDVLHWLSWLARKMVAFNLVPYQLERIQPNWLGKKEQLKTYKLIVGLIVGLIGGLIGGLGSGLIVGLIVGLSFGLSFWLSSNKIETADALSWEWEKAKSELIFGLIGGLIFGLIGGLIYGLIVGLIYGLIVGLGFGLIGGLSSKNVELTARPGQKLYFSLRNFILTFLGGLLSFGLMIGLTFGLLGGLMIGLTFGLLGGLDYGGQALIQHYTLRFLLARNNLLPFNLIPFLDHCTNLTFLRRVGGGFIFVHRLLMEHFAQMEPDIEPDYAEAYYSRGNVCYNLENFPAALFNCTKAIELEPKNAYAYNLRGLTHTKLGNYPAALVDYTKAIELKKKYHVPVYNVACLYALQGNVSQAIPWLRRAITIDKEYLDLALTNSDFDPIRSTPQFQALLKEFESPNRQPPTPKS